ncbi:MAG TPA: hypothetical protein VF388_01975 [Lacunisphaera sp.]
MTPLSHPLDFSRPPARWFRFSYRCLLLFAGLVLVARAAPPANYAQVLVNELMQTEADLVRCTLYSAPDRPGGACGVLASSGPTLVASAQVVTATTTDTAVFQRTASEEFEGTLTLYDRNDHAVGAIVLASHYTNAADEPRFVNLMTGLRNGLKVKIPDGPGLAGAARPPAKIYAQFLMERMLADHPELIRCSIHAIPPQGRVVNSMNIAYADVLPLHRGGGHSDHDEDFGVITTGRQIFYFWDKTPFNAAPMYKAALPLYDRKGVQVGAFIVGLVYSGKAQEGALRQKAIELRDSLKILIPDNDTLFTETLPPAKIRIQSLLEGEIAAWPARVRAAVYTNPPGAAVSSTYQVAGTEPAGLGRPADKEVFDVLTTGAESWGWHEDGKVFRGALPLYDRTNAQAGVLVVDADSGGTSTEAALRKAIGGLRDRLKEKLAGPADLFVPVGSMAAAVSRTVSLPRDPADPVETRIYSQVMVDETLAANPDLAALDIFARKPGTAAFTRIASNRPTLGQPGGPDELAAWREDRVSQRPATGSGAAQEVVLPLKAAPGNTIGAVTFVFKNAPNLDPAGQLARALALRDMLASKTPSTPSLFRIPALWMGRQ